MELGNNSAFSNPTYRDPLQMSSMNQLSRISRATEPIDFDESAPLVNIRSSDIANGNHTVPRIVIPKILESYDHNGYFLGNRNGRSIYNMILEGTCGFLFMATLIYSLYHLDLSKSSSTKKGIKNTSWVLLFCYPLAKNVGLLIDFYKLKKTNQYTKYSLAILMSNLLVWGFALHSFNVNYKAIFENLKSSAQGGKGTLKPHKFTGLFIVLLVDDYVQAVGLIYFLYMVYKKERIMDFYRDYFNPLNFCISSSVNGFLTSMVSQKKNKVVWISNFALCFLIGGYFLVMYVTYLYKLCKSVGRRRKQPISSKNINLSDSNKF